MKYIQLELDDELHKQLKVKAAEAETTMVALTVEALKEKLGAQTSIEALIERKLEEKLG